MRSHLSALQRIADRDGGNRAAGTRGYAESARYVAGRLRAAGWRVAVERFHYPGFRERRSSLALAPGGALRRGRDFRALLYSGSGRAEGPLTTAGEGCTPADAAMIRPGAVVLVSPGGCLFRTKARNAERAGAAGLLIMDPARGQRGLHGHPRHPGRADSGDGPQPRRRPRPAARGPGGDGRGGPHRPPRGHERGGRESRHAAAAW